MLSSAEIRWFMPGSAPAEVLQWFRAGRHCEPEPKHCDQYLSFPDCDTVRKFSADSDLLVEVSSDDWPKLGCNVEITDITVGTGNSPWFSLGFEAFGPAPATPNILSATLALIFGANDIPASLQLNGLSSMSYPAWLATLPATTTA